MPFETVRTPWLLRPPHSVRHSSPRRPTASKSSNQAPGGAWLRAPMATGRMRVCISSCRGGGFVAATAGERIDEAFEPGVRALIAKIE